MKRTTKARQLLKVAYATYRSGEKKIAADIFEMAMQDPSAPAEFGGDMGEMKSALEAAITKGDYAAAEELLKSMKAQGADPMVPPAATGEGEEEKDEGEAALSPGDEVPPPPPPELAPAQVASLVTLARKVKAGGHADLARQITKALGL